jgi:hypothetical protein
MIDVNIKEITKELMIKLRYLTLSFLFFLPIFDNKKVKTTVVTMNKIIDPTIVVELILIYNIIYYIINMLFLLASLVALLGVLVFLGGLLLTIYKIYRKKDLCVNFKSIL